MSGTADFRLHAFCYHTCYSRLPLACVVLPGPFHPHIWKVGSGLAHRAAGHCEADSTETHLPAFRRRTQEELNVLIDGLCMAQQRHAAGTMSNKLFENMQMVAGYNANPHGWLADPEVRTVAPAADICRFDWFHSCLQDGLLNVEMFQFLKAADISYAHIEAFLRADWCFPKYTQVKSRQLHTVFKHWRSRSNESAQKFKCMASDLLGVYTLVRHFIQTRWHPTPELELHRDSFMRACAVIDLMQQVKFGDIPLAQAAAKIREALTLAMTAHKAAYGNGHLLPKHHWMFDVAEQLERSTLLLDNFVVERLHLRVKDLANQVDNLIRWEESVLTSLVTTQMKGRHQSLKIGLRDPILNSAVPGVRVSQGLRNALGARIAVGDFVVLHLTHVGQVEGCAEQRDVLFLVVRVFALVENVSAQSSQYVPTRLQQVWPANQVRPAVAWYADGERLTVLKQ